MKGLLINGSLLILVGFWNLIAFFHHRSIDPDSLSLHWLVIGGAMIGYGLRSFITYTRFSRVFPMPPSQEDIDLVSALIRQVTRTNPSQSDSAILMKIGDCIGLHTVWKAVLLSNAAVFVSGKYFLMCDRKENISIAPVPGVVLFGYRNVRLRIGTRDMDSYMKRKYLERYNAWKSMAHDTLR
jgi:hypothetical protein